jgi:hypothetical protein
MNVHRLARPILRHFRKQRMQRFVSRFCVNSTTKVLDLGGSALVWEVAEVRPDLTILNLSQNRFNGDWFKRVEGDACAAPFADQSFDIVFSNSVVEHVGSWDRQQEFAAECMRCGKSFFVQTPNRWFPIDLHTLLPFVHWLPRLFTACVPWSPRVILARSGKEELNDLMGLQLLTKKQMEMLFPGAEIIEEKFCGFTKSLLATSVKSRCRAEGRSATFKP